MKDNLQARSVRRYDLDWLRILAILLLIPYHTARVFDSNPFYIKNEINSPTIELFTSFINLWFMPLFFFIAGAAAKYSLERRSKKQYCLERFNKLFIPLLFGIFSLIPIAGYFGFLNAHPGSDLSYYQYYPNFFNLDFEHIDGYTGKFTPSHLWFILYLFYFSLITLHLFHYLKTSNGKYLTAKLAEYLSQKPKRIFLLAIPLTLGRMMMIVYYNPVYLILFFILGYLVFSDRRFEQSMSKNNLIVFILAIIGTLFYLYSGVSEFSLIKNLSIPNIIFQFLLSLSTWCWVIVILNLARQFLNKKKSLKGYLNEASYPIYILHMTFVVPVAFYIVQWQAGVMVKFFFIVLISSIGIFLVYDLLIKRFNLTRFLFGMKINT